jgi:hypothetical protein
MLVSISLFFLSITIRGSIEFTTDKVWLDVSCVAQIWFEYFGDILLYMALFSKTWRIEILSQFRRQTVLYKDVMLPFATMMLSATAALIAWTIRDPPIFGIVAFEDNNNSKTMKMCYRNPFYNNISISFMIVSGVIALWMAWKTKNVREDLSDSNHVTHTIISHLMIGLIAVLLLHISHLLKSFTLWTTTMVGAVFLIAMAPLSFVVLPKVYHARVEAKTGKLPNGLDIIGRGAVRVTGLTDSEMKLGVDTNISNVELMMDPCTSLS